MNRFDDAVELVLHHERGYSNNPNDAGKETNFGISKHTYPDLDIKNLTREKAIEIYRTDFWYKGHFDRICYTPLCIKAFDLSVNMGIKEAIVLLQKAFNYINFSKKLDIDGILGDKTVIAINLSQSKPLYDAFINECIIFYTDIVKIHPRDSVFLHGWLNRVNEQIKI